MVSDDETMIQYWKYSNMQRTARTNSNKKIIKLGLRTWCKEDIAYRKQLSAYSLKKLEEIIKRKAKLSAVKRFKLYNTIKKKWAVLRLEYMEIINELWKFMPALS